VTKGLADVAAAIIGWAKSLPAQIYNYLFGGGAKAPGGAYGGGAIPAQPLAPGTGDPGVIGQPMNYRGGVFPPKEKTEIHNTTALNIDGATLARIVEHYIAENHELPDSASSSNGVSQLAINGWNPTDTIG
jgi:hypothetical protein